MARLLYWTLSFFLGYVLLTIQMTLGLLDCGCSCTKLDDSDLQTLLDLKASIENDPNGVLSNWDSTLAPCPDYWRGVSCDINNKVTCLDLSSQQLVGTIPESLGSLSSLVILSLYNNSLRGSIPSSLGSLTDLQILLMAVNGLSGSIPSSLGSLTNLSSLSLSFNKLNGIIPPSLENLANLQVLDLSFNQLNGVIPSALGNLTSITDLYLGSNSLTHSIPASLGSPTNLSILSLSNNKLNGSIPSSLVKLRNLQELYVSNNMLGGSFPSLPTNLSYVDMSSNQFSGSLTSGNISFLFGLSQGFDLTSNYFGHVNISLQNSTANLAQNCLAESIPNQRSNETCVKFCNATQESGICGGHGSCTINTSGYSCTCDKGFATFNNSLYTCQEVSTGTPPPPPPPPPPSSASVVGIPLLGVMLVLILMVMI